MTNTQTPTPQVQEKRDPFMRGIMALVLPGIICGIAPNTLGGSLFAFGVVGYLALSNQIKLQSDIRDIGNEKADDKHYVAGGVAGVAIPFLYLGNIGRDFTQFAKADGFGTFEQLAISGAAVGVAYLVARLLDKVIPEDNIIRRKLKF